MPEVQMPDGQVVDMPDDLSPELAARLRKFQQTQGKPAKAEPTPSVAKTDPEDDKHSAEEYEPPIKAKSQRKNPYAKGHLSKEAQELLLKADEESGKDFIKGVGETALSIGSGLYRSAKGGLNAIGNLLLGGTVAGSVKDIEDEQKKVYQPKTATGQVMAKSLATASSIPNEAGKWVGGTVGEMVGGEKGRIAGESVGEIAPAVIGAATGVKNVIKAGAKEVSKKPLTDTQKLASEFVEDGYALPPTRVNKTAANSVATGIVGESGMSEALSLKNQKVTNGIVRKELGLKGDVPLTDETFESLRQQAGQKYARVKSIDLPIKTDTPFRRQMQNLGLADKKVAAREFPDLINNPEVQQLSGILEYQQPFSPTGAIELVKDLRNKAKSNLKSTGDKAEQKHALGLAQREAADAIDSLMERELSRRGAPPDVVKDYQEARKLIAKTYDIESVTNTVTGNVSARGVGRLMDKGRPLDGGFKKIARVAKAYPEAVQNAEGDLTGLDLTGALMAGAKGKGGALVKEVTKPLVRNTVLTDRYQKSLVAPNADKSGRIPVIMQEAAPAVTGNILQQSLQDLRKQEEPDE